MTTYSTAVQSDPPTAASSELSHASIGQWGGVLAGILGGFAATVVLATLGGALGLTAGAAAMTNAADDGTELGVGAIGWILLTAALVGLVGGSVLARSSRPDRSYNAGTLGLVTWAGGIALAAVLAAPTAGGILSGAGNAAAAASRVDRNNALGFDQRNSAVVPADASARRNLTDEERVSVAAHDAARAAIVASWTLLLAQLVSLAMTVVAAKWQRQRVLHAASAAYAGGAAPFARTT